MKLYSITLPVLFAVAGFYVGYNLNEIDPISKPRKVSAGKVGRTVHSMVSKGTKDVYSAILLMPKSYLPMLQGFAKHRLAEDIKIIPAKIGWHENEMVVLPKKPILQNRIQQAKTGAVDRRRANLATAEPAPDLSSKIRAAAFLTLLASVKKKL